MSDINTRETELEAGKRRLARDTARSATTSEAKDLKRQAVELKEVVAEQALESRLSDYARSGMIGPGLSHFQCTQCAGVSRCGIACGLALLTFNPCHVTTGVLQ